MTKEPPKFDVTDGQARAFWDALIGETTVGIDNDGETVERPKSDAARVHLQAILGDKLPAYIPDKNMPAGWRDKLLAAAAYLRAQADALECLTKRVDPEVPF